MFFDVNILVKSVCSVHRFRLLTLNINRLSFCMVMLAGLTGKGTERLTRYVKVVTWIARVRGGGEDR